jgi:universal stress protein A
MTNYQRILAVVDLTEGSITVVRRAQAMAAASAAAKLDLLHIVEYVPVEPLSDALLPATQIESELLDRARVRMAEFATQLGHPPPPWRVALGNVKGEIVRAAREGGYDLIVLGSRERHGLSILVNLTEDTVLHASPCDVLAVRLAPGRA